MKQHFPLKNAQQEKRIYRSRVLISMGIVIFFMLLLVSRYAYLQLFNFESFTTASDENRIRLQPSPQRAVIFMTETAFCWPITIRYLLPL